MRGKTGEERGKKGSAFDKNELSAILRFGAEELFKEDKNEEESKKWLVKKFGNDSQMWLIAAEVGGFVEAAPVDAQVELFDVLLNGCREAVKGGTMDPKGQLLDFFGVHVKADDVLSRVEELQFLEKRVNCYNDLISQFQALMYLKPAIHFRDTFLHGVDDRDTFLHGVRDLLSIHSNVQGGLSTYVSAPGLLLFASSTTAQPILTPWTLMKELDEMEKLNARLSAAVEEVTLEHCKKNEIVKHHSQEMALQRQVFVDFFCSPERLKNQVRELTTRVRALQAS
ncbi:unnamed protein product [Lactuca virosa]|uniref:Uncharacterized protein n=1 Tax=Lactuca virosa TaxID=75947 RepID=A0AAU9PNP1_9ASTR|nr:unnamed protein product [Lactuca virosa]